jgi:signal peptidase I
MRHKLKLLVKIASIVLAVFIGVICFCNFAPGFDIYMVRSGSMKPAINTGDVIITGPVNDTPPGKLKPGSIVTFQVNKALTTHRVVSMNGDTLVTKGDANEDPDPEPVGMSQVKGVYLFKLPYVGYLTCFIRTRMGWWLAIILPVFVLVGFIIKDIINEALSTSSQPTTVLANQQPAVTRPSPPIATAKRQAITDTGAGAGAAGMVNEILTHIRKSLE